MWLTSTAIRRPIFIVMFVLALVVMGLQSRSRMPKELNPNVDIPYITVITAYSGAGPSEIETLVSEPIEKAVTSIGRLKNVTSTSQDGISTVMLEFEMGGDVDTVIVDGKVLMREHKITFLDEKALIQECACAAANLRRRAGLN